MVAKNTKKTIEPMEGVIDSMEENDYSLIIKSIMENSRDGLFGDLYEFHPFPESNAILVFF